ncbi:autotransporter outer membrane beta-barrel domain-containing protein, partial [Hafnia paralvei]
MIKAKRNGFLILMPILFPSISNASCMLSEYTYICSGSDTESPTFTTGNLDEMSVILQDGYNLSVVNGSAIELGFNSKITNLYSDGENSISNEDGSAVNIVASGDDRVINIGFSGDVSTKGGDGFTIESEGIRGTLNLSYLGRMDVQGNGVSASLDSESKMYIILDGDIHADYGISTYVGNNSNISIENKSHMITDSGIISSDIRGNSQFHLVNNGYMDSSSQGLNISAGDESSIYVKNNGLIKSEYENFYQLSDLGNFELINSGEVISSQDATRLDFGDAANIYIDNSGKVQGRNGISIYTSSSQTDGAESKISIINSGLISGEEYALSLYGAWADYHVENSGAISSNGIGSIYVTGHKSFTLALKEDWNIEGTVNIDPNTNDGDIADNKVLLTGDRDSSISLSRFRDDYDDNAYDSDSILGINYLTKEGSAQWTLTGEQVSGGFESVEINEGSVLLNNTTILMNDNSKSFKNNAYVYVNGHSTIDGSLRNSGALYINNDKFVDGFNSLNVTGNYEGVDGSLIVFNSALEGDNSLTDKLIINGDTSGQSNVQVNNLGGKGAQTIEGIELISVSGRSDGLFIQDGRIVAGAYDYSLVRGQNDNSSNWYLTSKKSPVDPTDPP